MKNSTLDRREFTRLSLLSMLSGVAITIGGCGGSGGGSNNPGSPTTPADGEAGSITANHGHAVTITTAQLSAGGDLLLTLTPGTPAHVHTVSLTGAEVVSIRDGARVTKESSSDDLHTHSVTFN